MKCDQPKVDSALTYVVWILYYRYSTILLSSKGESFRKKIQKIYILFFKSICAFCRGQHQNFQAGIYAKKGMVIIMIDMKKVGERIATLRKERGLTGEKLAELLYVSPQAVSKWETGKISRKQFCYRIFQNY